MVLPLWCAGVPEGGILSGQSCGNMSIFVTIEASYMGTIACHMAGFLTLETLVIVTGHGID